jgi:hypothetical protein
MSDSEMSSLKSEKITNKSVLKLKAEARKTPTSKVILII